MTAVRSALALRAAASRTAMRRAAEPYDTIFVEHLVGNVHILFPDHGYLPLHSLEWTAEEMWRVISVTVQARTGAAG
jgi:hypothetical protein